MKWFILFILGIGSVSAQQNYFNVVSSDITPKKKVFFQQQINMNQSIVFNSTASIGVAKNWEVGINIFNVDFLIRGKKIIENYTEYSPLVLVNSQYLWHENKRFAFSSGIQLGGFINAFQENPALFAYSNMKYKSKNEKLNGVIGLFYGDKSYVGNGDKFGIQTGLDYSLINHKFHLVADALISNNDISNTVLGCSYFFNKHIPVSLGWQTPLNHLSKPALVFEFTYIP